MTIFFQYKNKTHQVDLAKGIDISIPIRNGFDNPNCFWSPMPSFEAVRAGDFIGDTQQGGVVNFKNIQINPHGNGTHTECVGHIAKEVFTINQCLKEFHFFSKLVSIFPQKMDNGDRVITKSQLMEVLEKNSCKALIIKTMPNDNFKKTTNYSGANPPYLHHEAVSYLVECGVEHLLVDLPSVDREEDEGKLLAHKAFWLYPENTRSNCTITELIYVPNEVKDGFYFLNIQIASFEMDASPSKILLFNLGEY
jgi:kynurenine formamidase